MAQADKKQGIIDPMLKPSFLNVAANVLVIEDHADTAKTIGEFLMTEGYGVRVVESRDLALIVLDSNLYDFIIMDLFMPGLPAEDFVDHVHRRCRSQIILITATEWARQEAQKLGVHTWLGKPFEPEQLLRIFQERNR
jgi:DNA-binding response OmpR family regulator